MASTNKKTSVLGIYANRNTVDRAADALVGAGFAAADISVLLPENLGGKSIGTEKATKAPEGATAGATSGAVIGGGLGLLAGIGALAIPGLGVLLAAGPIVALLSGAAAGAAVGGVAGALVGMGIPEFEAKRYESAVKDGGTLLSVHCDTGAQIDAAKLALKHTGARDIASTSEASSPKREHTDERDDTLRRSA